MYNNSRVNTEHHLTINNRTGILVQLNEDSGNQLLQHNSGCFFACNSASEISRKKSNSYILLPESTKMKYRIKKTIDLLAHENNTNYPNLPPLVENRKVKSIDRKTALNVLQHHYYFTSR